jgi:RimJ/RimL family protein N-acetyltransferase
VEQLKLIMNCTPTLYTERLILRQLGERDFSAYLALRMNPCVYRFMNGRPMSELEVWNRITSNVGTWALMGFGFWAIEEKKTGELIGSCGFKDARGTSYVLNSALPEAGWWLGANKHGIGFAAEAVHVMHEWGDKHIANGHTFCAIPSENKSSFRLAHKVGYRIKGESVFQDRPCVLLERCVALPTSPL